MVDQPTNQPIVKAWVTIEGARSGVSDLRLRLILRLQYKKQIHLRWNPPFRVPDWPTHIRIRTVIVICTLKLEFHKIKIDFVD